MDRRQFLRRAAVTGAAVAWAAPVLQTISASPAFAQTNGTPSVCGKSFGTAVGATSPERINQGCMGACQSVCQPDPLVLTDATDPCAQACDALCPNRPGAEDPPNRTCCDAGACVVANWTCCNLGGTPNQKRACYTGTLGNFGGITCPTQRCYEGTQGAGNLTTAC